MLDRDRRVDHRKELKGLSPAEVAGFAYLYDRQDGDFGFWYKASNDSAYADRFYARVRDDSGQLLMFDHRVWHPRDEQAYPLFPRFDPELRAEVRTWLLVAQRLRLNRDVALKIAGTIVNCRVEPPYRTQSCFDATAGRFTAVRTLGSVIRGAKKMGIAMLTEFAVTYFGMFARGLGFCALLPAAYDAGGSFLGAAYFTCAVGLVCIGILVPRWLNQKEI